MDAWWAPGSPQLRLGAPWEKRKHALKPPQGRQKRKKGPFFFFKPALDLNPVFSAKSGILVTVLSGALLRITWFLMDQIDSCTLCVPDIGDRN